jgi:hypothetical protein
MCYVWVSEQTATYSFTLLTDCFCVTEVDIVYCTVRTESLYKADAVRL